MANHHEAVGVMQLVINTVGWHCSSTTDSHCNQSAFQQRTISNVCYRYVINCKI